MRKFIKVNKGHVLLACINMDEIKKDFMEYLECLRNEPTTLLGSKDMGFFMDLKAATIEDVERDIFNGIKLAENLTKDDVWKVQKFRNNGTFEKNNAPIIWSARYYPFWSTPTWNAPDDWFYPCLKWEPMGSDTVTTLIVSVISKWNSTYKKVKR